MTTKYTLEQQADDLQVEMSERRAELAARLAFFGGSRLRAALRERDLRKAEGEPPSSGEVASAVRRSAALQEIAERARVPEVVAEPHQAIVHGRVVGPRGGREGATVVVVTGKGQEAARTTSATVGYFCFVFPPGRQSGKPSKGEQDQVEVRLEVRDGATVIASSGPVRLARGKVVYLELAAK